MKKYAIYYCNLDVQILYDSIMIFRKWIQDAFNLDVFNFISISGLSLTYQKNQGCFQNVCKMSGNLRKFIQQCVVGGKCMMANNEKQRILKRISDLDGNSLYPSAQNRCHYPSGEPRVMK